MNPTPAVCKTARHLRPFRGARELFTAGAEDRNCSTQIPPAPPSRRARLSLEGRMSGLTRRLSVPGLLSLFLLLPHTPAHAEAIAAGDVLRLTFDMNFPGDPNHFAFGS